MSNIYDDDFSLPNGSALHPLRWENFSGNAAVIGDNYCDITGSGVMQLKFTISTDFVIKIDFELPDGESTDHAYRLLLRAYIDSTHYFEISAFHSSTKSPCYMKTTCNGGSPEYYSRSRSEIYGSMMIIRFGYQYYSYYKNGAASWTALGTAYPMSGTIGYPVYIQFGVITWENNPQITGRFRNFKVIYESEAKVRSPYDDEFTGADDSLPSPSKWQTISGTPVIKSNTCEMSYLSRIMGLNPITDDFSMEAELTMTVYPSEKSWWAYAGMEIDSTHYIRIGTIYDGSTYYIRQYNNGSGDINKTAYTIFHNFLLLIFRIDNCFWWSVKPGGASYLWSTPATCVFGTSKQAIYPSLGIRPWDNNPTATVRFSYIRLNGYHYPIGIQKINGEQKFSIPKQIKVGGAWKDIAACNLKVNGNFLTV